eukprot:TRINITY_DN1145_c1_g1_i1.p1 TRINITY_DN1145_c1_g1~~TRINITY_DN1145_c1_g1_i1.p1  ORF type:complete len:400 (+),score=111.67 TRINITY_DN1145_c1_g1_i1:60-1202(+)
MSLLAMPFLIINYGGEMIYILEQRLHSQQIKAEKAQKVLYDLTRALFNEAFINELLRPHALYTPEQTRDVCNKLAQSSIMKLSCDSMDKLFDLVVMGVKYQVMSTKYPTDLIDITLNHIDYISALGRSAGLQSECMDKARAAFVNFAKELRVSEYAQVRQALLDFSIRKRVKVSLFLQEKMQHHDGRFVIAQGGNLPADENVQMPGTIKNEDGSVDTFSYPLASCMKPKMLGDPYNPKTRTCTLGQNFYTIERKKEEPVNEPPPTTCSPSKQTGSSLQAVKAMSAGEAELNALGSLLGMSSERVPSAQGFKISLFDESPSEGGGGSGANTEMINIPRMTREELEKYNKELCGVIDDFDAKHDSSNPAEISDLLDLVSDSA